MIILANSDYYVKINVEGGQISRFKSETTDIEYIFNADPYHWSYSSPILFPIVGNSYDNKYHFNNEVYEMPKHGILRDMKFYCARNDGKTAVMRFEANEQTLKQYPFYFTVEISYTLIKNKLVVEYEIYNDGVNPMPFNFGVQPAFSCPLEKGKDFSDYAFTFSSPSRLRGIGPKVNDGLVSKIPLTYKDFKDNQTWVYHNVEAEQVGFSDGEHGVNVSVVGFPITSVWTNKVSEAPFICIEPSLGRARDVEKDIEFIERDGVMLLPANKKFLLTYTIEVF